MPRKEDIPETDLETLRAEVARLATEMKTDEDSAAYAKALNEVLQCGPQ